MRVPHYLTIAALSFLLSISAAFADVRVVAVHDGDTITVREDDRPQEKIRLNEIDAPELSQPYGQAAKAALSKLVFGKIVKVDRQGRDRYGRTLAHIRVDEVDVNRAMIGDGQAWVYTQYAKDSSLLDLQRAAKARHTGLWGLQADQRQPPWDYRRRAKLARKSTHSTSTTNTKCQRLVVCRQLKTCAAAQFQFNNCGASQLDGNHDGIPCNSLCR